ncbi:MAG: PilN domain-containing protein [Desulfobacteraceae bacterium]|nr:PilN domain-containing protein [Desulfobacteraceae bacterium]MBC2718909.1 PilN domain-containing protein [Desulfobacteraceae bacterium]
MKIFDKKLLAVEVAGGYIRAAVVTKKGRGFEILDFSQVDRPDPDDDLPAIEAIKTLATRLDYTSSSAVYVTSLARAVEISMNRKKISGMKHYQLMEAVKWEVEPYTGVTGMQALIGVKKNDKVAAEPGMVSEPDETDITVNVSVLERNIYRAIKERFKVAGFKLIRVYPPEVCFYMPVFMEEFEAPRAILDIGQDYSNFAILKGESPTLINTLPVSMEAIIDHLAENLSGELESALKFTARQVPEPVPLIISGPGAGDKRIVDYISSLSANGAEPISLKKAAGLTGGGDDSLNAVYATVAGAGIRELKSKKERLTGINDVEPLVLRLKKSAYLMPLIATVLLITFLFGHFQYMKWQENSFKSRITRLSAELKEKKARNSKYDKALKESDALKKEIELAKNRIAFATNKADEDIAHVINFFSDIAGLIPGNVVLETIVQENRLEYRVAGKSLDLSSVGGFATKMQEKRWCESVVIKSIEKTEANRLGFEFSVKTRVVSG